MKLNNKPKTSVDMCKMQVLNVEYGKSNKQ